MLRNTRILVPSLIAAGLTVTGLCVLPTSNAYAQSQPPGRSDQMPTVSDQKLDAAAAAIKQVTSVKEDYQQRIEAADPADKERISDEAEDAVVKAVTDQGLSVQEYSSILVVAQNVPEIKEKMLERLRRQD